MAFTPGFPSVMAVIKNADSVGPKAPGRAKNTKDRMAGSVRLVGISGSKMPSITAEVQVNPKARRKKNNMLRRSNVLALYPIDGVFNLFSLYPA